MAQFALNHMSVARHDYSDLLQIAEVLGCVGVEVRTDLKRPLFDGRRAADAGAMARDRGLRLIAVAELTRFNAWDGDRADAARSLIDTARDAGAEAVALIPRNDNAGMGNGERQANLRLALKQLRPMLDDAGLVGLVEPLGFPTSALRHKSEVADAISALGAEATFRLIHDTFHHALAGHGPVYPANTGLVHISGVADAAPATLEMTDAHRGLVDAHDRLGTVNQISALAAGGYTGPVSFEAFAPEVHALQDPVEALRNSMEFIRTRLKAEEAA